MKLKLFICLLATFALASASDAGWRGVQDSTKAGNPATAALNMNGYAVNASSGINTTGNIIGDGAAWIKGSSIKSGVQDVNSGYYASDASVYFDADNNNDSTSSAVFVSHDNGTVLWGFYENGTLKGNNGDMYNVRSTSATYMSLYPIPAPNQSNMSQGTLYFDSDDFTIYKATSATNTTGGDGWVMIGTNLVSKTNIQLREYVPSQVGMQFFNSTVGRVYVSTGTAIGQFAEVGNYTVGP